MFFTEIYWLKASRAPKTKATEYSAPTHTVVKKRSRYNYMLHFISFQSRYSRDIFLALYFQCGSKTVIFQTFSASRFCIISQCNACLICATLAISAWNGSVHLSSQFQNTITTLPIIFSVRCRKIRAKFLVFSYIIGVKKLCSTL